jgi:hypothetical protein
MAVKDVDRLSRDGVEPVGNTNAVTDVRFLSILHP